jgi:hypothetical protein
MEICQVDGLQTVEAEPASFPDVMRAAAACFRFTY